VHSARGSGAQRQAVLGVECSRLCHRCEQKGVRRCADRLAAAPSYRLPTLPGLDAALRDDPLPGAMPLRPVCSQHLPVSPGSLTMTLGQVAGLLGAEVQWLSAPESAAAARD
jgi:hypothetical protein